MRESKASGLAVALNGYGLSPAGARQEVVAWPSFEELVRTAEDVGFDAVYMPEIGAREAFAALGALTASTSRIGLVTGVLPIAARDERRAAMGAATLHELSGGRFALGLGSRAPVEDTRRYLRTVRTLLEGRPPAGTEPEPLDLTPGSGAVPIVLAALGPRMTRLAGEAADGVLLNWCTPERVARARQEIAEGAEEAGRDPSEVSVAVYVRTVAGHPDPDAVAALAGAASSYAAMPKYLRQFEWMGMGEEARAAAEGPSSVPEGLLRAVCAWGTPDDALRRLEAYREAGADVVVVYPVPVLEAVSSIAGTILGVAPHPAVER